MRIEAQARNGLNFSQVKRNPLLQQERLEPFVEPFGGATVDRALAHAGKLQKAALRQSKEARSVRNGLAVAGLMAAAGGSWVALSGHPWIGAGVIGLSLAVAGGLSFLQHRQASRSDSEAELSGQALGLISEAADQYAASLLSEGPGPDQYTDRRYFTAGIIREIATVHSRESGAVLRTQVELGGPVPRRLEANPAKGTVSMRSPQGDITFDGELKLSGSQGLTIITRAKPGQAGGSLTQSIRPDGYSEVNGDTGGWSNRSLTTVSTQPEDGFCSPTYVWESGQLASYARDVLYVANPIVPFQDLSEVRVLPDGVVGNPSDFGSTRRAYEAVPPAPLSIGTWSSLAQPQLTERLIETRFAGGFTVLSDQKIGTVRLSAPDGTTLEVPSTLVETNGAYRLTAQHPLGNLEQSLLPGEVLLSLHEDHRIVAVRHKSGSEPTASEHLDEEFLSPGQTLAVTLDEQGTYWVGEGASRIDLKPLVHLNFLEPRP